MVRKLGIPVSLNSEKPVYLVFSQTTMPEGPMPNCIPLSIFLFSCWLGLEEKSSYLHSNDSLLFPKAQGLLTHKPAKERN